MSKRLEWHTGEEFLKIDMNMGQKKKGQPTALELSNSGNLPRWEFQFLMKWDHICREKGAGRARKCERIKAGMGHR